MAAAIFPEGMMQSMTHFNVTRRSIFRTAWRRDGLPGWPIARTDPPRSKSEARRIDGTPPPGASRAFPRTLIRGSGESRHTAGESYFERRDATLPHLVVARRRDRTQVQTRAPPCFARSA